MEVDPNWCLNLATELYRWVLHFSPVLRLRGEIASDNDGEVGTSHHDYNTDPSPGGLVILLVKDI